ncbi:hypothetical protein KDA_42130 [Dictyobacter alpinus]|uniref:Uncharacterized protein n=1 Tax=Dictyobacter alpinus TaxID=2014873 RepID=A0A402BBL8_9CHLR|nr:hypothetical protein [Dictyobacter alpinus]GCE28729.1 hypothetical protein KDA_42130 [Dictyobacter alpinus]
MSDSFRKPSEQQQPDEDVEQLLSVYYGPLLPEQPLAPAAWMNVREQLQRRRRVRLHIPSWPERARRPVRRIPVYVQESYTEIARGAHIRQRWPDPRLRYRLRRRGDLPRVRVALLWPRVIQLNAVRGRERILDQVELDVLLASGLARYLLSLRPLNQLISWLLILLGSAGLLSTIILVWHRQFAWSILPLLITVCAVVLLSSYQHRLTYQADALVARWLGRERTCRGLHGLATRSQHPRRPGWSTPSLTTRARRICMPFVPSNGRAHDRSPLQPLSK